MHSFDLAMAFKGGKRGGRKGGGKGSSGGKKKGKKSATSVGGAKVKTITRLNRTDKEHIAQFGELHPADEGRRVLPGVKGGIKENIQVLESEKYGRSSRKEDAKSNALAEAESSESEEEEAPAPFDVLVSSLKKTSRHGDLLRKIELEQEGIESDVKEEEDPGEDEVLELTAEEAERLKEELGDDVEIEEAEDLEEEDAEIPEENMEVDVEEQALDEDGEEDVLEFSMKGEFDSDEEEEEGLEDKSEGGVSSGDYFDSHLEFDVSGSGMEKFDSNLKQKFRPLRQKNSLGNVQLSDRINTSFEYPAHTCLLKDLGVKSRLAKTWNGSSDNGLVGGMTAFQKELFSHMGRYHDVLHSGIHFENHEAVREVYCLHALNHVLKTRAKVMKNNEKMKHLASEGKDIPEMRDQGFTRPKVLIVVPFRNSALEIVNCLMNLTETSGGAVLNKKRFFSEFSLTQFEDFDDNRKPSDYLKLFKGNIDDCFRVGVSVSRKTLRLYSEFYKSDIIIASPLGLRTILGAEGDNKRDYDFLSSIEVSIFDEMDVFLMQNWEHVTNVFDCLNKTPKSAHDADFSRIRMLYLNQLSKFYRQSILFSRFSFPEMNSVFAKLCNNYEGKARVTSPVEESISQVASSVQQVFRKLPSDGMQNVSKDRLKFFVDNVLPDIKESEASGYAVFVSSYFDFVHLRNYFRKRDYNFGQLSEYSTVSNHSRTRSNFFHGRHPVLIFTERLHYFRRYKIRGIKKLIFYSLPENSNFYPELINLLEGDEPECTILYTKYDKLKLERVVGEKRTLRMLTSPNNVHMFC